jgi:hypothetical protein
MQEDGGGCGTRVIRAVVATPSVDLEDHGVGHVGLEGDVMIGVGGRDGGLCGKG